MMVTIMRYRIVWLLRFQAAAVIGYASLKHVPCHLSNEPGTFPPWWANSSQERQETVSEGSG
jgi:hypothetical protein